VFLTRPENSNARRGCVGEQCNLSMDSTISWPDFRGLGQDRLHIRNSNAEA
jgi:hypothetical protein